jgi:hypothetical protein
VPLRLAQPFRGQYSLALTAPTRIRSGAMAIDLNSLRYLYGTAQFEGYDAQGHRTTWVVALYNFDLVAHGRMLVTLYDTTDTVALGRMALTQKAKGDLVGQITLGPATYAVHWHKNLSL